VFLCMELCGLTLEALALQRPCRHLTETDAAGWARQLFCGLQDIHALGIIHRDIKPENLIIGPDGKLKIADFGWCAWRADLWRSKGALAGTFHFMAPEILEEMPQSDAVDVWSAGASLLELLTGQPLITVLRCPTKLSASDPPRAAKMRIARILGEIRQKCPLPPHARPPQLSPCCWTFCQALLVPQPCSRSSVASALGHSWLQANALRVSGNVTAPPQAHGMPVWGVPAIKARMSWEGSPTATHPSQQANGMNSWIGPVKAEHQRRSWDVSTSAASSSGSGSTPRAGTGAALQVLSWGDVNAAQLQHVWPAVNQLSIVPPLASLGIR